jgi:hypothetical protein
MKVVTAIEGKTQPVKQFGGADTRSVVLDTRTRTPSWRSAAAWPSICSMWCCSTPNPRESHNAEVLASIQALLEGSEAEPTVAQSMSGRSTKFPAQVSVGITNRLRELVGDLVEPVEVVDVVVGVGIAGLDEIDEYASDQAEGFTGEQVVLRELVDFDDSCAEFVELVFDGFTVCHADTFQ